MEANKYNQSLDIIAEYESFLDDCERKFVFLTEVNEDFKQKYLRTQIYREKRFVMNSADEYFDMYNQKD